MRTWSSCEKKTQINLLLSVLQCTFPRRRLCKDVDIFQGKNVVSCSLQLTGLRPGAASGIIVMLRYMLHYCYAEVNASGIIVLLRYMLQALLLC